MQQTDKSVNIQSGKCPKQQALFNAHSINIIRGFHLMVSTALHNMTQYVDYGMSVY
jgi:hypothetical protein